MEKILQKNEELFEKYEENLKLQEKSENYQDIAKQEVESFKELVKNLKLKNEKLKNTTEDQESKITLLETDIDFKANFLKDSNYQIELQNSELKNMEKYKKHYDNAMKDDEIQYFDHISKNFPLKEQSPIFLNAIIMLKARMDKILLDNKRRKHSYKTLTIEFQKLQERYQSKKQQLSDIKQMYFKSNNSISLKSISEKNDKDSENCMLKKRERFSCAYNIQVPDIEFEDKEKQKILKVSSKLFILKIQVKTSTNRKRYLQKKMRVHVIQSHQSTNNQKMPQQPLK